MGLKSIKQAVLRGSGRIGLTAHVAASNWRQRRLLILCYHGISLDDEHEWHPSLFMSVDRFRDRLNVLRDRDYTVLPLAEAVPLLYQGRLPRKAVTITFDDGNYDFYAQAYPVLQSYGYPATLYLTTYYCRDQRPVFDLVCSYILWRGLGRKFDGAQFVGVSGTLSLDSEGGWQAVYERIYRYVRDARLSADDKEDLARALAARLEVDYQRISSRRILHLMTPEEVQEVAKGAVDVQLHTHRHRTPRDREEFLREIRDNRRSIGEMTGDSHAAHFCYPSGDTDPRFLPWLRGDGVKTATTCQAGLATRRSDPLLLPRILDGSTLSNVEFEGWLSGLSSFLPRRKL
jgi:peptidoglycan/xylan/chitin deacetylase (PgdA/CDA1 family)